MKVLFYVILIHRLNNDDFVKQDNKQSKMLIRKGGYLNEWVKS